MINAFKPAVWAGLAWAFLAFILSVQPAAAAPTFPPLTGRVVDDAHILSPATQAELTQELAGLEQKTSRQLVVVTLPSLQGLDIADYGYQLGRAWNLGQKGTRNGALFIIAPNERKMRIEVDNGLEGVLTDAISNVIQNREVLPRFRQGDMEGGIVAGTRALVEQLSLDTSTAEQRAAAAQQQQQQVYGQRASRGHGNPIAGLVVFLVIVFVISTVLRGGGGVGGFLGGMFLGSLLGGGRRYDDDGWGGGGGGGGGGFSGGGGGSGFSGGGSSGSW
ncbi:MAG TPA: TPM domain-containing protein [Caulobacteraceae bacterium]